MRVHQIINSYTLGAGGAERLARRLHSAYLERGMEARLLGLQAHEDHVLEGARSLGLSSPYGWKALRGVSDYLRKEVRSGDIVHAHLFPTILYCSVLRSRMPGESRLVATEHNTSNRRRGTLHGKLIDRLCYANIDRVACIFGLH